MKHLFLFLTVTIFLQIHAQETNVAIAQNWKTDSDFQGGIWQTPELRLSTFAVSRDGKLLFVPAEEPGNDVIYLRDQETGVEGASVQIHGIDVNQHPFVLGFMDNDTEGNVYASSLAATDRYPLVITQLENCEPYRAVRQYQLKIEAEWYAYQPVVVYGNLTTGNFTAFTTVWTRPQHDYIKGIVVRWVYENSNCTAMHTNRCSTSALHICPLERDMAILCDRPQDGAKTVDVDYPVPTLVQWNAKGVIETIDESKGVSADNFGNATLYVPGELPLMIYPVSGTGTQFQVVELTDACALKEAQTWATYPSTPLGHTRTVADISQLNHFDLTQIKAVAQASTEDLKTYTIYTHTNRSGLCSHTLTVSSKAGAEMAQEDVSPYSIHGNSIVARKRLTIYTPAGAVLKTLHPGQECLMGRKGIYIVKSDDFVEKIVR